MPYRTDSYQVFVFEHVGGATAQTLDFYTSSHETFDWSQDPLDASADHVGWFVVEASYSSSSGPQGEVDTLSVRWSTSVVIEDPSDALKKVDGWSNAFTLQVNQAAPGQLQGAILKMTTASLGVLVFHAQQADIVLPSGGQPGKIENFGKPVLSTGDSWGSGFVAQLEYNQGWKFYPPSEMSWEDSAGEPLKGMEIGPEIVPPV